MKKKSIAITLGVMCFVLTIGIVVQYKTITDANKVTGTTVNSELKTEVLRWKEKYEEAYKDLDEIEKILEERRTIATSNDQASLKLQKELRTLNALIGALDVSGEGVVITLADNSTVTNQTIGIFDNISNYLIHDTDLIMLVNELKNAGAEAISINDERNINTTSITCDGTVVLVNGKKLTKLPNSKKELPKYLDKNYGINKVYELTSLNDIYSYTVYYVNSFNNEQYYVPVTKYINNENQDKVKIIIDELATSLTYETNLMSYLDTNVKLLDYEIIDNKIKLNFNNSILSDITSNTILEEVL